MMAKMFVRIKLRAGVYVDFSNKYSDFMFENNLLG